MKKILLFALILFFVTGCNSSDENKNITSNVDISGWGKIQWGMNKEQILKKYNCDKTGKNGYTLKKELSIEGVYYIVILGFNDDDVIEHILLSHEKKLNEDRNVSYLKMEALLSEKYGFPDIDLDNNLIWVKKSGAIELFKIGNIVFGASYYPKNVAISKGWYAEKENSLDKI